MSKVIMVSRTFPEYHPKKGEPTYFVENIWKSLWEGKLPMLHSDLSEYGLTYKYFNDHLTELVAKHHTIRAGKRWKTGDMASLRVWSGKPYRSPQITIAPDVELTVKDVQIKNLHLYIDSVYVGLLLPNQNDRISGIMENDGLTYTDFYSWFKLPCHFSGQILIWNNNNLPY